MNYRQLVMTAVLAANLWLGGTSLTQPAENPRAIIEAAIKAYGGKEKLARILTGKLTAKTSLEITGLLTEVTWEESFECRAAIAET